MNHRLIITVLLANLLMLTAKADWITLHSNANFTVKNLQFADANGTNNGVVKIWISEYEAEAPNTTFYYTFPSTGGMAFEQAKIYVSLLLAAYTSGKKINIALPGTAGAPSLGVPNIFSTIKLVN